MPWRKCQLLAGLGMTGWDSVPAPGLVSLCIYSTVCLPGGMCFYLPPFSYSFVRIYKHIKIKVFFNSICCQGCGSYSSSWLGVFTMELGLQGNGRLWSKEDAVESCGNKEKRIGGNKKKSFPFPGCRTKTNSGH